MGHDRVRADKLMQFAHDPVDSRGLPHHGVGDAGQFGNEAGHIGPSVHQALIAVHDGVIHDSHRRHFGRSCTLVRRHAGGLEVQYDESLGHGNEG